MARHGKEKSLAFGLAQYDIAETKGISTSLERAQVVMNPKKAQELLKQLRAAAALPNGAARTDDFPSLRHVDAKVREAHMVIVSLPGFGARLAQQMDEDIDFEMNSRRVRLEALATYCDTALRFLTAGVMKEDKKQLLKAPDVSKLTAVLPELEASIKRRWYEAQKCRHASAYLASIVMMGSVLEALLLARANLSPGVAYQAKAAPKKRDGSQVAIHDWTLNALIDVAAEVKWIKIDRKNFSHALRDSRNVVHPWHEVSTGADFDRSTCDMCWQVLKASVEDLLGSI